MSTADRLRWDEKYSSRESTNVPPDEWLEQCMRNRVPGAALEIACGLGHNAIWLAEQEWDVDAIDISPVGLALAAETARRRNVSVQWLAADLDDESWKPPRKTYDLIVVFRFLDRVRLPRLVNECLAPGGILVYETFVSGQLARPDNHLRNPAFALQPRELIQLYGQLTPLEYEEVDLADRSVARLVARKNSAT